MELNKIKKIILEKSKIIKDYSKTLLEVTTTNVKKYIGDLSELNKEYIDSLKTRKTIKAEVKSIILSEIIMFSQEWHLDKINLRKNVINSLSNVKESTVNRMITFLIKSEKEIKDLLKKEKIKYIRGKLTKKIK